MNATNLDKVFDDVGKCGPQRSGSAASASQLSSLCSSSFSWCQIFTSRTSCSTTTSRAEWLQTSWGSLPTKTSEFCVAPDSDTFLSWLSRAPQTLRTGLLCEEISEDTSPCLHFCTRLSLPLPVRGRNNALRSFSLTFVPFVFVDGAWPLPLWTHITTPQGMTSFCLQEFFRLRSIVVLGLRRCLTLHC